MEDKIVIKVVVEEGTIDEEIKVEVVDERSVCVDETTDEEIEVEVVDECLEEVCLDDTIDVFDVVV